MAERKGTNVHEAHELVNQVVAPKLQAMARAKQGGRRRAGLNSEDVARVIRRIQGEQTWEQIVKAESQIDPKALEGWKAECYRRAGLPEGGERIVLPKAPDPKFKK